MIRLYPAAMLVLLAMPIAALSSQPSKEIQALVDKLGSEDFAEREAASKELEALGSRAIDALRTGCESANAERARRAKEILGKALNRLRVETLLSPTLVEFDVKDEALDAVLDKLSKQSGYEVVLGGLKPDEIARKKVTVNTRGKVPFWIAIQNICDVAMLEIGGVCGSYAPGALQLAWVEPRLDLNNKDFEVLQPRGFRKASRFDSAVVLVPRTSATKRPCQHQGAVLVEVVQLPKRLSHTDAPTFVVQVWPEPGLGWYQTFAARVTRASSTPAAKFTQTDPPSPSKQQELHQQYFAPIVVIRTPEGKLASAPLLKPVLNRSAPTILQARVEFGPEENLPQFLDEVEIIIQGAVATPVEELIQANISKESRRDFETTNPVATLSASYNLENDGKILAEIGLKVDYLSLKFRDRDSSHEPPGARGEGVASDKFFGAGLEIRDSKDRPFRMTRLEVEQAKNHRHSECKMTYELTPTVDGQGKPRTISLWGSYITPINLSLTFQKVPISLK